MDDGSSGDPRSQRELLEQPRAALPRIGYDDACAAPSFLGQRKPPSQVAELASAPDEHRVLEVALRSRLRMLALEAGDGRQLVGELGCAARSAQRVLAQERVDEAIELWGERLRVVERKCRATLGGGD